jgi:hypothetical protein
VNSVFVFFFFLRAAEAEVHLETMRAHHAEEKRYIFAVAFVYMEIRSTFVTFAPTQKKKGVVVLLDLFSALTSFVCF